MSHEEEAKAKIDDQQRLLKEVNEQQIELARAHDKLEEKMKESVNMDHDDDNSEEGEEKVDLISGITG